ncbi:hypothetical protein ES703_115146 [subsurface metagenome]
MSSAPDNNISRIKLQKILAAIGSEPTEDTTLIGSTEYDWHRPRYFNSRELEKLDDFTREIAAMLSKKLTDSLQNRLKVTVASTTQHYADEFLSQTSEEKKNDYNLAFGTDQNPLCGVVSIPLQTAIFIVTQLLSDSESEKDSDRVLSELEESLLLDITHAIIETLSNSFDNYYFHATGNIVKGQPCLELQGTEELCAITLNIKKTDSENNSEARLLMFCNTLDPIIGKTTQVDGEFSAEDISKAIVDHLQKVLVTITARLGSAVLAFEEVMSLQPCDILLLDKEIDEPVELIVQDQALFRGQPAKSAGNYAVVITELCEMK